jgi:Zn-dependent M16 (insulinase) family peptidase
LTPCLQDFYNLVDVYLDAVLHPTCVADKQVFEQEGWHYELEDPADDITLKGVVFNEMKGVYSSPDSVLGRECQRVLFPDNTYGVDSGGDPAAIPSLTFEEFQEFHAQFYHPTNGRFWFYGDDDPAERLRILDGYLSEFSRRDSDSSVKVQSRFTEPKYMVEKYAASADSDEEPKTFLAVNWLLSEERFDVETELAFSFLNFLMLGTPAAPLRKALESSGLGEALVGGGLEDELRQPTFTIGLKGVKGDNVAKVRRPTSGERLGAGPRFLLITDTLLQSYPHL